MDILRGQDPIVLFQDWLSVAAATEPCWPEAAALATTGPDGRPAVRMVLLKGATRAGFVFHTNMDSRKGREIMHTPFAALCFHWKSQDRQVRVEGAAAPVPGPESDAYFATRPRLSQLGAWASLQSQPLDSRETLEGRVREYAATFGGNPVPRPLHWGGVRIVPDRIEFWQQGEARLHDRFLFTRGPEGWDMTRLYP